MPMVLNNQGGDFAKAATVYDPQSGRQLECWTTEPAVHFFTATNLAGVVGKNGQASTPISRVLPGNAALSRFAQSSRFSQHDPPPRPCLPADHRVSLLHPLNAANATAVGPYKHEPIRIDRGAIALFTLFHRLSARRHADKDLGTRAKVIGLDYYYNHQVRNGRKQFHYIWDDSDRNSGFSKFGDVWKQYGASPSANLKKPRPPPT